MARVLLCPSCKAVLPASAELRPASFPFCSERCRMVDLGKWLNEEFVVPQPISPDDHEALAQVIAARTAQG